MEPEEKPLPPDPQPAPGTEPEKKKESYPPALRVGMNITKRLDPKDVDHLNVLFKRKKTKRHWVKDKTTRELRPMTMADMIGYCIAYTKKHDW